MTVHLIRNTSKPKAAPICIEAAKILLQAGAQVILSPDLQEECELTGVIYAEKEPAMEQADVVISVGGDGTILHSAKDCLLYDKPILGINLGRTGFLATCELDEMPTKLALLAKGEFQLDYRALLEATVEGDESSCRIALNDVVISKGVRLQAIDYDIYCNDVLVNHCRGDGVIVSTPTGSTAYSLSAGGPILDTHIQGLVVTPICAHALQNPTIVFAADRHITIRVSAENRNEIYISSDGCEEVLLHDNTNVQLKLSQKHVKLITFNQADQFDAIGTKLRRR